MERKIRVAIAGVGNCASSLVQGVHYYRDARPEDRIPGLMHVSLGGYHIRDIEFVAAFDVDAAKVGKDLAEAIFAGPNNTYRFAEVPALGVTVQRGPTLDGLGKYLRQVIVESEAEPVDVAGVLRETLEEMEARFAFVYGMPEDAALMERIRAFARAAAARRGLAEA
ncbi:MAG: hypothetical protein N2204_07325, partial [Anaerolineae bacterium]|nr:hypothetical protein [Anaerolineae bacterium]